MSHSLVELSRQFGVQVATHVWTTTVATQPLIAAPGANRVIRLLYVVAHQSAAAGLLHLTNGTTAATSHWYYNAAGPHAEEAFITCDTNTALTLHGAATIGNGFIRVYYTIGQAGGTTE